MDGFRSGIKRFETQTYIPVHNTDITYRRVRQGVTQITEVMHALLFHGVLDPVVDELSPHLLTESVWYASPTQSL